MCERYINQLPLACTQLGAWPATQACALTGNWTSDLLVHRVVLSPLSHTSQGINSFSYNSLFSLFPYLPTPVLRLSLRFLILSVSSRPLNNTGFNNPVDCSPVDPRGSLDLCSFKSVLFKFGNPRVQRSNSVHMWLFTCAAGGHH